MFYFLFHPPAYPWQLILQWMRCDRLIIQSRCGTMPTSSTEVVSLLLLFTCTDWQSWCFYFVVYFKLGNRRLISLLRSHIHEKKYAEAHRNEEHSSDYFFYAICWFCIIFLWNKSKTAKREREREESATRMNWCMHFFLFCSWPDEVQLHQNAVRLARPM